MGRARETSFGLLLAVLTLPGLVACGSSPERPEPNHPLTDVVHRLQDRFEADDDAGVCALMSKSAADQAGNVGHKSPTTCARDVRRVFGMIESGGGWLDGEKPRVVSIEEGDVASATVEMDGWRGQVPFVKEGGGWKLASFFGMEPKQFEHIQDAYPSKPFPRPGRPVTISDSGHNLCPPLSDAKYPRITGGCLIEVSQRSVPVEMLTPFGGFKFDDCNFRYRVHVDGQGRTWTDRWEADGANEGGCADLNSCYRLPDEIRVDVLPWKGRIRSDGRGGFTHNVDMCLRTCMGLFAGEVAFKFAGGANDWRLKPADANDTGVRFNGSMSIESDPLRLNRSGLSD
jgi:hypothetical protein